MMVTAAVYSGCMIPSTRLGSMALPALLAAALAAEPAPRTPADQLDRLLSEAESLSAPDRRRADLALPLFRQALARLERENDPAQAGRAWVGLGRTLQTMHRQREAEQALERGRELARIGRQPGWEGQALRALGGLKVEQGDFEAADRFFQQLFELAARTNLAELKIQALNNLSVSARRQGRLSGAIERGRTALRELDRSLDAGVEVPDPLRFQATFNLGRALAQTGDYAGAMPLYERALETARSSGNIAGVWHVLEDLGEWYQDQGDLPAAEDYYRRALEQSRHIESKDPQAVTLRSLGSLAEARGELSAARDHYSAALELFEAVGYRSELPVTLVALSRVESSRAPAAEAARILQRAQDLARAIDQPLGLTLALVELGRQRRRAGDHEAATAAYQAAFASARDHGLRPLVPVALAGLGQLALDRRQFELAAERFRAAADALERIRSSAPSPHLQATFVAAAHSTYAGLFESLMALQRRGRSPGAAARAFAALERERSQNLIQALLEAPAAPHNERAAGGISARRRELEQRIAATQLELLSIDLPRARRAELLAQLDDAEGSLQALESAPESASEEVRPLPIATLKACLRPEEVFISYAAGDRGITAFVVTREALRAVDLPPLGQLESRIESYSALLAASSVGGIRRTGGPLAQTLIAPLRRWLPPAGRRLLVSATGALAGLPLATLPDPARPGEPLVNRYEVAELPSLTALAYLRRRARAEVPGEWLAVADPVSVQNLGQTVWTRSGPTRLAALPASRDEVESIRARLGGTTRLLLGREAAEQRLKSAGPGRYRILHFATHALLDPQRPARSAIILGSAGEGEDGWLQTREIYGFDLGADLVVLSGCVTAGGQASSAEGILSLARAFLHAGAQSVLGTRWMVEDEAASRLVQDFYAALLQGLPVGAALRQAQLGRTGEASYSAAADWSAWVIVGDPAARPALTLRGRSTWHALRWPLAIGILLLLGLIALARRSHDVDPSAVEC